MTIKEKYDEAVRLNTRNYKDELPTFAEYKTAAKQGRIVQDNKHCIIVSNELHLQFSSRK